MRLVELVKIDNRFEKSVNLLLDLNNQQKIKYYIPTRSSIKILNNYLDEILNFSGGRANILIGPYGKGKSHLLLILMSILSHSDSHEIHDLIDRISKSDKTAEELIQKVYGQYRFLPVIVNTNSGNLEQAFVRSLNQALKREGLNDVVPDNYFSEAVKMIHQWETLYPSTYFELKKRLAKEQVDTFVERLKQFDYKALDKFRRLHPDLTSGSEFNPVIDDEVLSVYRSVNRRLCEQYGYSGIYVIFDEFSKYVEGHTEEGFSADMKVLQDICELCNASKDEQLHLTCVAHKAIRSYGTSLSKEVKNAFRGVEGRLREIPFFVSSQNNYELLADAIQKKDKFSDWKVQNKEYEKILAESYRIPDFNALFNKKDFDTIVGDGCYPLTPLSALLLTSLSEKIAQNERTIFTFLTGKDMYSLANYIIKCRGIEYVGAGLIYDYFAQLFEEDKTSSVHYEWLKADYAISKIENNNEKVVIKSLAVIHMINRQDDIPGNDMFLRLASGLNEEKYKTAINSLIENKILKFKQGIAAYEFQNGTGIKVDNEISDCVQKYFTKVDITEVLNEIYSHKYILPKKYNQRYSMTRYYKVEFIDAETFLALSSLSYIKYNNEPDGFVFVLLAESAEQNERAIEHIQEINEPRAVLSILPSNLDCKNEVRRLLAVRRLMNDKVFIEENETLLTELKLNETEMIEELNSKMISAINTMKRVYTFDGGHDIGVYGLNRLISDICEAIYNRTPKINHELINRHNISAQISKARNILMDDLFHGRLMNKYETGTSAESTIFRAVMMHTANDPNLELVRNEIVLFIHESRGRKVPFSKLINKLISAPIGMRKGVLPIYITEQMMELDDMPVVYLGKKELSLNAQLMANIMAAPAEYYLYVEVETGQKLEYIEKLEMLFADYGTYCREIEKRNRLSRLICIIQSWYRSLPQTSMTFMVEDYEGQPIKEIDAFRKLFAGSTNPREILFDQIPKIFDSKDYLSALESVKSIKETIDAHVRILKKKAEKNVRRELGLSDDDDFLRSIKAWYDRITVVARNSLYSMDSQRILNCIRDLSSADNEEIIEKLSKEITGFFVEDWKDSTINSFSEGFSKLISEIEEKSEREEEQKGQKLVLATESGTKECFYDFDPDDISTPGYFFQNALDDMINEYGDSLENNEKIGILMNMVKKLMG